MNIGHFLIEQLSEGLFEVSEDGAIVKVQSPNRAQKKSPAIAEMFARRKFTRIGLDPVLITNGKYHILLEAGLGIGLDARERTDKTSNILTNLDIFGVKPEDIDFVVLSHLHYDHMAGISYSDHKQSTHATLPNAKIIVQKAEWDYALTQLETTISAGGPGYETDELYRLYAEGRIQLIDKEFHTLIHGIDLIKTGGHTPGHQIIRIHNRGDSAYYFGDLIPTEFHLNHYGVHNHDTDPDTSRKMKLILLKQAWEEKALLLFYHSAQNKNGRLIKDDQKRYTLLASNS